MDRRSSHHITITHSNPNQATRGRVPFPLSSPSSSSPPPHFSFLAAWMKSPVLPRGWAIVGVPRYAADTFDPTHRYVTSPLFPLPVFAALRSLIALYALCTICTTLGLDVAEGSGPSFLSFFTDLSYIGLTAYYIAAAVQTVGYARYGSRGYVLQRWPRALQAAHVLLQGTITTFPFIVTAVFWSLLSSPSTFATKRTAWGNISIHALNSVFAFFDLVFTNVPPAPWISSVVGIVLLGGYLGVAYITHKTQGFYTYGFLDPQTQHATLAAYIIGIAAGQIILFCIVRGIVMLRQRLCERFGRVEMAQQHDPETLDQWEEVEVPAAMKDEQQDSGSSQKNSGLSDSAV
ncbi:unnamed protein product [Mycena citricolor]|uniref:Uncharacterized protein n=1 Tax=Mycena citricolor TaxID=2018698 RepID=A0AAD2JZP3_9AGAR|nr:unnamed protein product [Mycena citricolor]CAK5271746.1 unnamed protein product [Mycena citricolor]